MAKIYEVCIQTAYGELYVPVTSLSELTEDECFEKACDEIKEAIDWSKLGSVREVA